MCLVLIVDDDRETNGAIAEVLGSEGYTCISAEDGDDGLRLLCERKPDVVLLDLYLPRVTGTEFLLRKAEIPVVAGVPVIVITALSNPPILDGTVATLRKPFSLDDLLAEMRNFAPPVQASAI